METLEITNPKKVQALIRALSDEYSRKMLYSTIPVSMTVGELSRQDDIPFSTCYRRAHELLEGGLLIIEDIVVTPNLKRHKKLRSTYKEFRIDFDGGLKVEASINEDTTDKVLAPWISVHFGSRDVALILKTA